MLDIIDKHGQFLESYFPNVGQSVPSPDTRNILICFLNRSGSNYLAWALQSTEKFNLAQETFAMDVVENCCKNRQIGSVADYVAGAMQEQQSSAAVFSAKVSAHQLVYLTDRGVVGEVMRNPVFVYVRRRDVVAQAISHVIAFQTHRWTALENSDIDPVYDPVMIDKILLWLHTSQALFEMYFQRHGVKPIEIWYEDFVGNEQDSIDRIASAVHVDDAVFCPASIPLKKQATGVNEEFKRRYLQENAL